MHAGGSLTLIKKKNCVLQLRVLSTIRGEVPTFQTPLLLKSFVFHLYENVILSQFLDWT